MELTRFDKEHVILPDGSEAKWMEVPANRYFLAEPGEDRWDVVLARVSSDLQDTLYQQVDDACRAARNGGRVIQVMYLEPGFSAFKLSFSQRTAFTQLLEDIVAGRVRSIYVYKRDRVARHEAEWMYFKETCRSHGVEICFTCPGENAVNDGMFGDLQESLFAHMANIEAKVIRQRVQTKTVSRFRAGEWVGGPMPYGYRKEEDGRMVEHPTQGPVVRAIFELAVEKLLGCVRIADHLNEHYPGTRYGRQWDSAAVEKVLTNRVYCGYQTMHVRDEDGKIAETLCERSPLITPFIPEEVWDRLVAMRQDRRRQRGVVGSRFNDSQHLLFGLLHCGKCGARMYGKHRTRCYTRQDGQESKYHSYTYACAHGQQVRGCPYRAEVRQENIDEVVLAACRELFAGFDVGRIMEEVRIYRQQQLKQVSDDLTIARRELGNTSAAIQRNQEMFETCDSESTRHFQQRITELIQRRHALQARLSSLEEILSRTKDEEVTENQVATALENWPERFKAAPHGERRAMLIDVIRRVTWHPDRREVDIEFTFDPDRPLFTLCRQNTPEGVPSVAFCRTKSINGASSDPEAA